MEIENKDKTMSRHGYLIVDLKAVNKAHLFSLFSVYITQL